MEGMNKTSESAYLNVNYYQDCLETHVFINGECIPLTCITNNLYREVCNDDFENLYCSESRGCVAYPTPNAAVVADEYWK